MRRRTGSLALLPRSASRVRATLNGPAGAMAESKTSRLRVLKRQREAWPSRATRAGRDGARARGDRTRDLPQGSGCGDGARADRCRARAALGAALDLIGEIVREAACSVIALLSAKDPACARSSTRRDGRRKPPPASPAPGRAAGRPPGGICRNERVIRPPPARIPATVHERVGPSAEAVEALKFLSDCHIGPECRSARPSSPTLLRQLGATLCMPP